MKVSPIINKFNFGEVSPLLCGRVDFGKYQAGCRRLENFIPLVQGPVTRRGGTRFIAESGNSGKPVALLRFEFSESLAYVIEAGHLYLRFFYAGAPLLKNGSVYQVSAPWRQEDIFSGDRCLLKCVQSGDVLYVVSPGRFPQKICRYGHVDWRIAPLNGWETMAYKTKTITETVVTEAKITNAKAQSLYLGQLVEGYIRLGGFTYDPASGLTDNSTGQLIHKHPKMEGLLKFVPNDGYYHVTSTQVTRQVADYTQVKVPNPTAIALFRERLCLASGQTIWMSASGAFEDFALPAADPQADDPIEISIYSEQMNKVEWMCPAGGLLIGTSGGEFTVSEASQAEPLGPGNIKVAPETNYGSSGLQALRVGAAILFVQRAGRKLRELVYEYSGDSYTAQDISIAAEHITQGGLAAMAWQSEPHEILWLARRDGVLVGFTYNREQEMTAWHRHILGGGGRVEALAVIPGAEGDELWLSVARLINGQTRRYMELMTRGLPEGGALADSFFVDSGKTVTGRGLSVISGLGHLEGREVSILADGGVCPPKVVKGGQITLDQAADKIQAGLGYQSLLETMPLEIQMPDGTLQGRVKRLVGATLRVHRSSGGAAGPDENNLEEVLTRAGNDRMDEAPELAEGDVSLKWPGGHETKGALVVVQKEPLPFTLCAVMPDLSIGGAD